MPMATAETQREYQRVWMLKRRDLWLERLGNKCVRCGSEHDLEFDHIDPDTKTFNPGTLWSRRGAVIADEMAKCQLLCHECHRKKTNQENGWGQHGIAQRYRKGCRCQDCRDAQAARMRKYRATRV